MTKRRDHALPAALLIIITIFFPPAGVALVAGCGADICVNICLTILGFIPGHIHAFYLEYVYYKRRQEARQGLLPARRAPGVYSERVQYPNVIGPAPVATTATNTHVAPAGAPLVPPPQQGYRY